MRWSISFASAASLPPFTSLPFPYLPLLALPAQRSSAQLLLLRHRLCSLSSFLLRMLHQRSCRAGLLSSCLLARRVENASIARSSVLVVNTVESDVVRSDCSLHSLFTIALIRLKFVFSAFFLSFLLLRVGFVPFLYLLRCVNHVLCSASSLQSSSSVSIRHITCIRDRANVHSSQSNPL